MVNVTARYYFIHFVNSGHFYSAPSSPLLLRGTPDYCSTDTVSEFHAEAHRATVGKGLAQGPYMAARAGVEPTTLRLKAIDSTKAPPCRGTWWRLRGLGRYTPDFGMGVVRSRGVSHDP